ncbi:MAG: M28 family peptidase [Alphaproteobacteria bacterium]
MLHILKMGAIYSLVVLIIAIVAALWYSLGMPGRSYTGPLPPATDEETDLAARLKQHVVALASTPHNIRHYANLEAAARYLDQTLTAEGYHVVSQSFEVDGKVVRNLEITIEPPESNAKTKTVVIGAHYDSVFDVPGANDNGSSVAAILELGRLLKDMRPTRTRLRLVLFVNEEPPYFKTENMGSFRYAQMLAGRNEPVSAMIALDTIGYFSDKPGSQQYPPPFDKVFPDQGNFIAFVGMPGSRSLVRDVVASFRRHTDFPSIGGIAPGFVPGIDWSDHWSFVQHGFPAMLITDTAVFRYPHYHELTDTPDKVNYERLARVTKGIERILRDLVK